MVKKDKPTLDFDGPPLPTLYSRPANPEALPGWGITRNSAGTVSHGASLSLPWNVYDGAWPPNLVTTRPTFAEAEAYIREWHQDWRRRRDKGEAA